MNTTGRAMLSRMNKEFITPYTHSYDLVPSIETFYTVWNLECQ